MHLLSPQLEGRVLFFLTIVGQTLARKFLSLWAEAEGGRSSNSRTRSLRSCLGNERRKRGEGRRERKEHREDDEKRGCQRARRQSGAKRGEKRRLGGNRLSCSFQNPSLGERSYSVCVPSNKISLLQVNFVLDGNTHVTVSSRIMSQHV